MSSVNDIHSFFVLISKFILDFQQRDYNSSLLDSYAVPPANEAIELQSADEFDFFKHTILLVFLSVSMFVGKY